MELNTTNQQVTPPAQNTPPEHIVNSPLSSQKGFVPVIIGVVVLLIVVAGGAYYLGTQQVKQYPTPLTQEPTISPEPSTLVETPTATVTTSVINTPVPTTTSNQVNGASLNSIKYTLPQGWKAEIRKDALNNEGLSLAPESGGGYLWIRVYDYSGTSGRREYYCQVSKVCIEGTSYFNEMSIGNISGYSAHALDNSGGGTEYFGSKGNRFYIISSYNPPSPNQFENNYKNVLNSLRF